jgi:hypothetical protein
VRIHPGRARDGALDGFDLILWQHRDAFAATENHVDPRRGYNLQAALEASPDKQVTRKQGQRDNLPAVFPAAARFVKREEDIKAFGGEHIGHDLLVLMARVNRPPAFTVG